MSEKYLALKTCHSLFSGFDQFDHLPIITRLSCIVRIQAIIIIIIVIVIVIIIAAVVIIVVLQANFTM